MTGSNDSWASFHPARSLSSLPDSVLKKLDRSADLVRTNRGPELRSGISRSYSSLADRRDHVCWGDLAISSESLSLNFLVAGVPGTGKTVTIRNLLHSVFGEPLRGRNRAVLYDPKNEFYPILRGYGMDAANLCILNPFDDRAQAWDLAADFTSPADALQLASTLLPEKNNSANPFFRNAAVSILTAIIETLTLLRPSTWSLSDVIRLCMDAEQTRAFLQTHCAVSSFSMAALGVLSSGSETRANVFSELNSRVFELIPIASLWQHASAAGRKFSLRRFIESSGTAVILGASQQFERPLMLLNRLLIKRLSEFVLDRPPIHNQAAITDRTWLILDELRQIGKVEGLARFVAMGRDRGVCAVFGFQDYPALTDALGKEVAHELVSCCRHKLFLRLDNESAKWASEILGKQEVTRVNLSHNQGMSFGLSQGRSQTTGTNSSTTDSSSTTHGSSSGPGGGSSHYSQSSAFAQTYGNHNSESRSVGVNASFSGGISVSTEIRERDVVLPSEISNLPFFGEGDGLHGFSVDPGDGEGLPVVCKIKVSKSECLSRMRVSNDPSFLPADPRKQMLPFAPES